VFAEIISGIALVNKAADQIKKLVTNANDVTKLAQHIDDMFEGESQINKKRNKRSMFSVHSVAEETINAKLARERLNEMGQLIDLRFGHGTWAGILKERADRIHEAKEEAKRVAHRKRVQYEENLQLFWIISGTIIGGSVLLFIVYMSFR
tara:strand:+ start:43581 stop:44030 length:450 start_codon:yes stop_codon:yes gene_type:complete